MEDRNISFENIIEWIKQQLDMRLILHKSPNSDLRLIKSGT